MTGSSIAARLGQNRDDIARELNPLVVGPRLERTGLVETIGGALRLTRRGRFLGDAVTVELMKEVLQNATI